MEPVNVFIDSDSVLCDLVSFWCAEYNKRYSDNLTPKEFGGTMDGVHEVVKPECGKAVYDMLKEPGMFLNTEPYSNAMPVLNAMCMDPRIKCFITTAYSGEPEPAADKVRWYLKHAPFFPKKNIVLIDHKELLHGAVLIDDGIKNIVSWCAANPQGLGLLINQDHNAGQETPRNSLRVDNIEAAYMELSAWLISERP